MCQKVCVHTSPDLWVLMEGSGEHCSTQNPAVVAAQLLNTL